jgi:hypothetical protein
VLSEWTDGRVVVIKGDLRGVVEAVGEPKESETLSCLGDTGVM